MYDWIPCLDKIHSYFNIVGYAPILDENVINYSCNIPSEKKYDHIKNRGKLILREILNHKKLRIIEGKRGFSPDLFRFWENFGREMVSFYLNDSRVVKSKIINHEWIINAIRIVDEKNDIRYINKLLSVLALEIWYRLFFTNEIKPKDKLL